VGAHYIVTDLDLRARFDLSLLDAELQLAGLHGGVTIWKGVWRANYSSSVRCCRHPAEAIDYLLGIVDGLGDESRDQWDRCISRRFDMGFEGFKERFYSRWQLRTPLLRRLAAVKGELVVTIYRPDKQRKAV
jgi:hypothetical protein